MIICRYKKSASAFSLIELSIVILIIGIIIAGVTQASRLVKSMRLSSVAAQTKSSPVASIKGLVAWFETTSPDSFPESTDDNSPITDWLDISPQSSVKNNASQSTSDSQPLYIASGINDLPVVSFDGVDDVLNAPEIIPGRSDYTVFIVEERRAGDSGMMIGSSSGANLGYDGSGDNIQIFHHLNGVNDWTNVGVAAYSSPVARILCFTNKVTSDTHGDKNSYLNGEEQGVSSGFLPGSDSSYLIGFSPHTNGTVYYNGYIGEIITFNRQLKNEERVSITQYLSKKWKIALDG